MKRLVICCDGTWNRPDSVDVTNIEKIARTIQTEVSAAHGVQQLVYYLSGVGGAGYQVDRLLGGAFGFGLFRNVLAGYRFLAQNYDPGDEIFVFGFSRGAYTARSLAGMVGRVGLLTRAALVDDLLPESVRRYQRRPVPRGEPPTGADCDDATFRARYCHPDTPVHFLGVFDTVGALGVPGAQRLAPRWHDVELGAGVRCARQALAIDETRLKFQPTLWEAPVGAAPEDPRVKQVWFAGAHSDVGGGYARTESGLSDTALLWMAREAAAQGLVFDTALLDAYLRRGGAALVHDSLRPLFRALNVVERTKLALGLGPREVFHEGRRRLAGPRWLSVRVAQSAADWYAADGSNPPYRPMNLRAYQRLAPDFTDRVEPLLALPREDDAQVRGVLAALGGSPSREGAEPLAFDDTA